MAWRSSGTNNDELVDNLKRFGVISSPSVETAFREVDRKFFVPKNWKEMAHADQPLKEGNVHISAPHIYGSVLEALDLKPNSSMTFLNAGSGTGYLTCIAATLMGPRSNHFCIEIHEDVVNHCKDAIAAWREHGPTDRSSFNIDIMRGNALNIDLQKGECGLGFDRIYIGASIETCDLPRFKQLLKPGGILVGPVEDELVKVTRGVNQPIQATMEPHQYTQQVISPVRFAPLLSRPALHTIIPAQIWHPSHHWRYPDSFRKSCKVLMLCSGANYEQPTGCRQKNRVNVAAMLPRALWLEILSYTHRDWFIAPQSEIELLRSRLSEERARADRAEAARLEAESLREKAEKERDMYKILARGWRERLENAHVRLGDENLFGTVCAEEAAAAILISTQGSSGSGLGSLLRRIKGNSIVLGRENSDTESSQDSSQDILHRDEGGMGEDLAEDMVIDNDTESVIGNSSPTEPLIDSETGLSSGVDLTIPHETTKLAKERPKTRSVSILDASV